jgi:hypothetical protein
VKFWNAILRIISMFVLFSVIQSIAGVAAKFLLPGSTIPPMPAHFLPWLLVSNALTIAALSVLALRTEWRGWSLGLSVAAIPVIVMISSGIEGIMFLKNLHIDWPRIILSSLMGAVLIAPVWMLLFGRLAGTADEHFHPFASQSRSERVWKFVLSAAAYPVLYFVAGSIVWPYVKDFYATQALPGPSSIVLLQLFVRGPIFVVLCLMLVRMLGLPRLSGALVAGAVFTIITGIAPLLIPNPYFPDAVRWAHFCEVSSSNFVFAAFVAWLWGQPHWARSLAPARSEALSHC